MILHQVTECSTRVEVHGQAEEVLGGANLMESNNIGVVESGHDGCFSLDILLHIGILNLAERHHLQGDILVQDDVVGQHDLAEGSLANGDGGQLVVTNGCQPSLISSHLLSRTELRNLG